MEVNDWMDDAACKGMDTNIFFPERGESCEEAKAICRRCPVNDDCREYALSMGSRIQGVWGGTSDRGRRSDRSGRGRVYALKPIDHGTYSGYNMHRHRGIPPCDACKSANTRYHLAKRASA